ncbi:MAG: KpsF/GutQ family sugar-phosphate isomerase [Planctomycetota bacterium]|jgi:arabinose-5-phosphate isomerase|nr:KpsF/GutQ family sugar-phosphate isomerase [Planctomycetota bacterium]
MTLEYARLAVGAEIAALQIMRDRLDGNFLKALDAVQACSGRVIMCGMGKAGLIGQKIAATLASTGTPSFFLHPAEALHGDLGMITPEDVCVFLSNSGESGEVSRLLPHVRRLGATIIGVTGSDRSTLAAHSDILLHLGHIEEACPLGLAPTATTTSILALGDALAMCLMRRRGFKEEDYARVHPAGALGRKVAPIEALMRVGDAAARVDADETVGKTLFAMTRARAGAAAVLNGDGKLAGIFCDGDLRRGLERDDLFMKRRVGEVMIRDCAHVREGTLAGEVLDLMKRRRIAEVPVVDENGRFLGMADLKGLVASM